MKLEIRKRRIEKWRKKGLTYEEIGSKYKISAERVRQILTYEVQYCEKHRRKFIGECSYCKIENEYVKKVHSIMQDKISEEIFRLSGKGRKKELVLQRVALIKTLKDTYSFNFSQIGHLLKRDITTIKHLYNKQI